MHDKQKSVLYDAQISDHEDSNKKRQKEREYLDWYLGSKEWLVTYYKLFVKTAQLQITSLITIFSGLQIQREREKSGNVTLFDDLLGW